MIGFFHHIVGVKIWQNGKWIKNVMGINGWYFEINLS